MYKLQWRSEDNANEQLSWFGGYGWVKIKYVWVWFISKVDKNKTNGLYRKRGWRASVCVYWKSKRWTRWLRHSTVYKLQWRLENNANEQLSWFRGYSWVKIKYVAVWFISKMDKKKKNGLYWKRGWRASVCLVNVKTLNTMITTIDDVKIVMTIGRQCKWTNKLFRRIWLGENQARLGVIY